MTKELRAEAKREYVRGLEEAKQVQKQAYHAFLQVVRDRLSNVIRDSDDFDEAEEKIDQIIQLIDEYTEGDIPAQEIIDREKTEEYEKVIKGLDTDDVISLTDFVRDDF